MFLNYLLTLFVIVVSLAAITLYVLFSYIVVVVEVIFWCDGGSKGLTVNSMYLEILLKIGLCSAGKN